MAHANVVPLDAPVGMPPLYDATKFDWSYYGHSFATRSSGPSPRRWQ